MKKLIVFILLNFLFINVYALGEATLENIKINNKECQCAEYKCEMEISESSVNITYELTDPSATVDRESGVSTLINTDVTTIRVNVTNGDNHNVYEFIITKHIKSSDYTLKELYFNEEEITLLPDVYVYNASVKFDEEEIIIDAVPNDSKASVDKELVFLFPIEESSKSFDFKVKAENGDEKNYRIFVTRKNRPDTSLKSLKISNGTINFDKDIYEYNLDVDYIVNDIIIEAIPNDEKATVKINKESLQVGNNVVTIEVTNDNVTGVYTLNINRSPNLDKSQANLAILSINEYSKLNFDPNVLDYELVFKNIPSVLTIDAKSVREDALVEILNNENLKDNHVVSVKVTLSDPEISRVYNLKILKQESIINESKLPVVIALIILVIVIIVLIILNIKDSKKRNRKVKKQNSTIKKQPEIVVKKEEIEEIEIL